MTSAAATTVTPPPMKAPTAKERKYDRQLRLWAASGQQALEESHVLLIIPDLGNRGSGSSVAGIETLKNLVLPGIGSFTIADSATVIEADLGINFFLEAESLGKSRAEEVCRLLMELNPDVEGNTVTLKLSGWPESPDALNLYNLIILCAPIPPFTRQTICRYARDHSIPLIYIHSLGFYSTFSVQLPTEFPIVDTHPDPESIQDLRLLSPWPELTELLSDLGDLHSLNDHDHGHIPYVLILLHYLFEWSRSHPNAYPISFKEKSAFRDLVRGGARTNNVEGGEENFDEAVSAVLRTISPPTIDRGCAEMFAMNSCKKLELSSPNFWIIAAAIRTFHARHGVLPLPGSLPDMKAKSEDYIRLQNLYKAKARSDVAEVLETVRATERRLERPAGVHIPATEVERFCKNAAHVKIICGQALPHLRLAEDKSAMAKLKCELESLDMIDDNDEDGEAQMPGMESLLPIFAALLAAEEGLSYSSCSSSSSPSPYPPRVDQQDVSPCFSQALVSTLFDSTPLPNCLSSAMAEVSRAAGGEMHNISAVTGGMVAQEAIKIITRQYVPVARTVVYDGISGRMEVLEI